MKQIENRQLVIFDGWEENPESQAALESRQLVRIVGKESFTAFLDVVFDRPSTYTEKPYWKTRSGEAGNPSAFTISRLGILPLVLS